MSYKAVRWVIGMATRLNETTGTETDGRPGISYGSSLGGIQQEVSSRLFLNVHRRNFSLGQNVLTTYVLGRN